MNKIQVYHFHHGGEGGVLSVIRNLCKFSNNPNIGNHIIHVINKTTRCNYSFEPTDGAISEQTYYYYDNNNNNRYLTYSKLAKLLPNSDAIIIAHDIMELKMVNYLGLQNRVIHFLHGDHDYYYNLAQEFQSSINKFITVANDISINLKSFIPSRISDIDYLRFPVPNVKIKNKRNVTKNIIFIGRLEIEKGYNLLPTIDAALRQQNIFMNWHIVGENLNHFSSLASWEEYSSVFFYGKMKNNEVLNLLSNMDYYILPSLAEGLPVSLIESMKAGIIPLVNNIKGGIQEIVINNVTGFKIIENDPILYAESLAQLHVNEQLTLFISKNCINFANKNFDPYLNTDLIEKRIIQTYTDSPKCKVANKMHFSRLDKIWIPNIITKIIRRCMSKMK